MWGKLVLGAVGFVIGGPIGSGVGVALGDQFDQSQTDEERTRTTYFVSFFSSLAKIAKADGKITKDEIDAVKNIFKELELDEQQKEFAIQIFNEAKNNTSTIKEHTDQLAKLIEYEKETGEFLLRCLCDVAKSDGNISDAELALLYEAENSFRLRQGIVDELIGVNQSAYFVSFFSSLAKIAKADGKITKDEIDAVKNIFKELELDEQQKEVAIQIFNEAKNNTSTIKEYTDQLAKLIEYEREAGESFLRCFYNIAISDGNISSAEIALLYEAENSFRLRQGTVDELIEKNKMSLEEAYSLLGCSSTMTEKEIRSVYRKKCNDFHPDKLHSKNLPPEFTKFANEQLAKIIEAHEIILASYKSS